MEISPIGKIRSCFGGKFGTPRQPGLCPSAWGHLVFEREYRNRDAVRGLEGFSHVWLVFGFHETAGHGWTPTVRPPRLGGNQRMGVFATRSTFRPNGLGLSLVELERVEEGGPEGPVLHFAGLDLIDGTPVYDIKPYLAYAESIPLARSGYAGQALERIEVRVEESAKDAFESLGERGQRVVREVLSLDPRPAIHAEEGERVYGADLCGKNIRFQVRNGVCWVVEVR